MATVYMMIGIPGSGKTTLSKIIEEKTSAVIISTDKVRQLNPGIPEADIWPKVYALCASFLAKGCDIIYDATNITKKVRSRFDMELAKYDVKYEKVAIYVTTSVDCCIKRVAIRNTLPNELFLPLEVISSYGEKIVPPSIDEGFKKIYEVNMEERNEL